MNKPERTGAPALGNALGYFAALWMIEKVQWLDEADSELAVAMMGVVFIHLLLEGRSFAAWLGKVIQEKRKGAK